MRVRNYISTNRNADVNSIHLLRRSDLLFSFPAPLNKNRSPRGNHPGIFIRAKIRTPSSSLNGPTNRHSYVQLPHLHRTGVESTNSSPRILAEFYRRRRSLYGYPTSLRRMYHLHFYSTFHSYSSSFYPTTSYHRTERKVR